MENASLKQQLVLSQDRIQDIARQVIERDKEWRSHFEKIKEQNLMQLSQVRTI